MACLDGYIDACYDNIRDPTLSISINSGGPGTGKTTQLLQLCRHFEEKFKNRNGRALYFTLDAEANDYKRKFSFRIYDKDTVRLEFLILPATTGSTEDLSTFWEDVLCSTGLPATQESLRRLVQNALGCHDYTLATLCREVMGLEASASLLLAADCLNNVGHRERVFRERPVDNELDQLSRFVTETKKVLRVVPEYKAYTFDNPQPTATESTLPALCYVAAAVSSTRCLERTDYIHCRVS